MAEEAAAASEPRKPGKLRWVLGWIVVPGTLIAALFLTGVHFGARNPNRPVARLLLKLFGGKPGIAEVVEPGAASQAFKGPRPGAEPGPKARFSTNLSHERLQLISEQTMIPISELSCDDLCWAAQDMAHFYSVDDCAFARSPDSLPSMLVCQATLEKNPPPREGAAERAKAE